MANYLKKIVFLSLVMLSSLACQRKNCPVYWAGSSSAGGVATTATDGEKEGGQNLNETETGGREAEFPMVRVKRDKNGIVTKKAMRTNKVKRTDPRKSYRPR